jgi:EAL domain-containing protein (putative c-di-GMP-specific phosphodiesterase class I)
VETAAELDAVAAVGVPLIQGWYYGRPGPPWPRVEPGVGADSPSGYAAA